MASTIKVRVPGTTANCGPGFDAVGIACTIYNDLAVTLTQTPGLTIDIQGEGAGAIPANEKNIVWKAVQRVFQEAGFSYQGVHIAMHNHVPMARGLGSSAAAIVGGLVAANALTGNQLTQQRIFDLATEIEGHPDNVAPALFGGITLSTVEETEERHARCLRFVPPSELHLVVAVPAFTLSTKASRQVLPKSVSMNDAIFNISRTAILIGALCQGEFSHLRYALQDKLHQPYRQKLIPGMPEVLAAAVEAGALGAVLSGAGPCLMAYTVENVEAVGQAMIAAFARHQIQAVYHKLAIDTRGAQVITE